MRVGTALGMMVCIAEDILVGTTADMLVGTAGDTYACRYA